MNDDLESDIIFYQNGRGGFAVSVDGGENLILANGKKLLNQETAWGEAEDEELAEASLSMLQMTAVEEVRNRPPLSKLDKIVLGFRRDRLVARKDYPQPERTIKQVPEIAIATKSDLDD